MLVVTWPYSNTRYAVVLPGETAECVCDGLRTIFEHVGRAPTRIVFDNATGVGRRVRNEITTTKLFQAFKLHYRFTAMFTNPDSGHEKGSVENAVGYIRRNALVPVPHVESFPGLSNYLLTVCDGLLQQLHYRKDATIQSLFAADLEVMRELPGISFDVCTWESRRVDKVGNIEVQGVKYYIGDAYSGQRLNVGIRAFTIEARTLSGEPVASHTRVYGSQAETVRRPEQLLPGLLRKPGALLNSPLQHSLPEPLRTLLLEADSDERRRLLRVLEQATQIAGFDEAVIVMNQIASSGRQIEAHEVEMVATRAREQHHAEREKEPVRVDLSVYDRFTEAAA